MLGSGVKNVPMSREQLPLFYPNVEFILNVGSDDHISMVFYTLTRDTKYVFN